MGDTLKRKGCDMMRILVVEDDHLLNNTLCYNLNTMGYTVDAALSKQVAVNFIEKQNYECFILGKHTARNGVAGISPPRREFQKC